MLNHELNLAEPDAFYEELIAAQRDLSEAQAELMNAKLLLILANQIVDRNILREALEVARSNL
ncbi:Protein of unknown function DUF2783 [Burkholderia sp. lig30]|uniref:DUF2783 domain-containing protein n=1 Tax=Burkholderia sp. lig30 TaxID=1192124 RepID=UPI000461E497|nr:DUF2783 domain-containing protein [Burkholderia sp. lig30]KDB06383.1 Protein of unknown function DUF2783 [Burkholderia sp. lig30]